MLFPVRWRFLCSLTNTELLPAAAFDVDANEQQDFFSKSINFNLPLLLVFFYFFTSNNFSAMFSVECWLENENFQSRTFPCFAARKSVVIGSSLGQHPCACRSRRVLWMKTFSFLVEFNWRFFCWCPSGKSRICAVGVVSDNGAAALEAKNVNKRKAPRN